MAALKYIVFETDAGWMGILRSRHGLQRSTLPQSSAKRALGLLVAKNAVANPELFGDLVQRFRAYFGGETTVFPDQLDLSPATIFQRRVWQATQIIGYGTTRSYAWVAQQIGQPVATRAVGQALACNPLPIIIPCHRVLTSTGRLGGYGGGLKMKKYLLALEGAHIDALSSDASKFALP